MMKIKTPRSGRVRRALEKRAPKLVETGNKTLILQGAKTSGTLNEVLSEIYPLKKGGAVRFTRKNDNIRPFETNRAVTKAGSAAEASVEGDTLAAFSNKLSSPNSSALEKMPSFSIDESPSSSALDNNPAFSTLLRTFLFSSCLNTSLIKVI
ncbi:hypothetical protein F3Y22_tig00111191pilonHSYRG00116 [Hibiscus syriacus]|uniref:Ribosome production factor 2 homolog n=1 Tax=Hibiscus syriacus TaxID=106335 RepID=A0A6A2YW98_HIBSY|nr:hypothetical protein F3Y22_tig00111191pilonHSYRG00116 [Hibiscus syriacus]